LISEGTTGLGRKVSEFFAMNSSLRLSISDCSEPALTGTFWNLSSKVLKSNLSIFTIFQRLIQKAHQKNYFKVSGNFRRFYLRRKYRIKPTTTMRNSRIQMKHLLPPLLSSAAFSKSLFALFSSSTLYTSSLSI